MPVCHRLLSTNFTAFKSSQTTGQVLTTDPVTQVTWDAILPETITIEKQSKTIQKARKINKNKSFHGPWPWGVVDLSLLHAWTEYPKTNGKQPKLLYLRFFEGSDSWPDPLLESTKKCLTVPSWKADRNQKMVVAISVFSMILNVE